MTQGRAMVASRLGNRLDMVKLAHRRPQGKISSYATTAPAQVQASQQRNLYANFAIYKGKAAASFRVSASHLLLRLYSCYLKYFGHFFAYLLPLKVCYVT